MDGNRIKANVARIVFTLLCFGAPQAEAQNSNLVVHIPINKDRRYYNYTTEDGKGRVCGVKLYAVFDVYKNYTNISSYASWRAALVGIQNPSGPRLVVDGERKYFEIYCYFNGSAGPDGPNANCNHTIGEGLPEWETTLTRTPPRASFTASFVPSSPGEVKFQSTSVDPEDPEGNALRPAWEFGDQGTGSGDIELRRYAKPGRFNVKLTVTNPDGLVGSASREISIPAPRPVVTLQLLSKHSGNRIEPGEEFRARLAVEASAEGVGALTDLVFNGSALNIPALLTVIDAPAGTNIGTLTPGERKEFEWTLRADGLGDFVISSGSVAGRDEAGQSVFGQAASQRGEVTALIVGIQQRPQRIVLGEDNNEDGVVDGEDALVQVIVGITNVAKVDVTDVRTDDTGRPIHFTTRLLAPGVALDPMGSHSGDFGTIRPGAGNALVRTNWFQATNYVFATASLLARGKVDTLSVEAGAETLVKVERPGVKVTMHALEESGLTPASILQGKQSIDAPLEPITTPAVLDQQPEIDGGLIGDGVTPLVLILEGDTQALAIANEGLKIRLVASVKSGGELGGASLQDRIRLLGPGGWVKSESATMTQTDPRVYASLDPIRSDDIKTSAGSGQLQVNLRIEDADTGTEIESFGFALRKPPIALVHGYNTDGTWGNEFREILEASRGIPFVRTVRYGQRALDGGGLLASAIFQKAETLRINTLWPLEDLAPILDDELEAEMSQLKPHWAFTRYDVVAHSQGGVLSRMLSTELANAALVRPFRNENNHFRGRFHRIVTIGSPHNGTRLLRYFLALDTASLPITVPSILGSLSVFFEASQAKFDPWGEQIRGLNQTSRGARWFPDPGAAFHLIRTTVNDGRSPSLGRASFVDTAFGLDLPGVGNVVIPRGSDAIVDYDSMAASSPSQPVPANVYTVPAENWISHAKLPGAGFGDVFGGTAGQVDSSVVARHAIAALDQDSSIPAGERVFGPFRVPDPLPDSIRAAVDLAAEKQAQAFPDGYELAEIISPPTKSWKNFELQLNPPANQPVGAGGVRWIAETYGTNGIATEELILTPDPSDPARAKVQFPDAFVGDVVAYAAYVSTSNRTILSSPYRLASAEPASEAVEMIVLPQETTNWVGTHITPQVFVRHADETVLQRFAAPGELSVSSDAPSIVDVSNPLRWSLSSAGKARVTATWRGLTSTREVTVVGHAPGALPVPEPLVWLRADAGLSLTNGTNVLAWTDQSRNNFVFASRTEAARPKLVGGDGAGPAALRFDSASRSQLHGNLGRTLSNATIFTLVRLTPQSSARYIYAFGTRNTSGFMMTLARRGGDDAYHYDGAAERETPGTWAGTNYAVLSQTYGGEGPDHHRLDLNGRTVIDSRTTTGRAYAATATNIVIGNYLSATYNFTGELVEWIVYDRALGEPEKAQVEEYLRLRGGLPAFTEETSRTLSAIAFGVGSPDRSSAIWTYSPLDGSYHALGGVTPSITVLNEVPQAMEVRTRVSATGTNGAIGVIFGYENRGNFYLLDWRAVDRTNALGEIAPAGLHLLQFHTPPDIEAAGFGDFYGLGDSPNSTVLITNELTWVPDRSYEVVLRPETSGLSIQIFDEATQLLALQLPEWTSPIGWFGHYSHGAAAAQFGPVAIAEVPQDEPITLSMFRAAADGQWTLQWSGGPGTFLLETTSDLDSGIWLPVGDPDSTSARTISAENQGAFFRVRRVGSP